MRPGNESPFHCGDSVLEDTGRWLDKLETLAGLLFCKSCAYSSVYIYAFLFFIIWGEFLEGKSSKHSKIKNVSCKLLIKVMRKTL